MVTAEILDVTRIEPKLKHPTIFKHFDDLEAGESFIIDNDHDPKPLYYQLLGERGNIFKWEYLQQGPLRWQVKIAKNKNEEQKNAAAVSEKDLRKATVFKAKGIDYSCNTGKASEKISEGEKKHTPLPGIDKLELNFLSAYIVNTYHAYIKNNAEVITGLAEKVAERHGSQYPQLNRLAQSIPAFFKSLHVHIDKEDNAVLPAIKQIASAENSAVEDEITDLDIIKQSLLLLQKEHVIITEDLEYFRRLTNNYTLPDGACNSFTYFYQKLEELHSTLTHCMHVEEDILFPKVAALEAETAAV